MGIIMYKSFKSFKEQRNLIEFGYKFENLCLQIHQSGVTFDEFWENVGLPVILSESICAQEQLFEGWSPTSWDWKGLWNNMQSSPTGRMVGAIGNTLGGAAAGAVKGFNQSQMGANVRNFFNPQQTQQPQQPNQPQSTPQNTQPNQPAQQTQPTLNPQTQAAIGRMMDDFTKAVQTVASKYQGDPVRANFLNPLVQNMTGYINNVRSKFVQPTVGANSAQPQQVQPAAPVTA